MKKSIIFAMTALALSLAFTSCDKSGKDDDGYSFEGRWDLLPEDVQPGTGDQRMTLIFNGSDVDIYIVAWGDHLKSTYKYENEQLKFDLKIENAWDALIVDQNSTGWSASDGALDPETFELKYTDELPYHWYRMDSNDFARQEFAEDVDFLSNFPWKFIDKGKASGGPMEGMFFYKR